jgi:hypothetical protein
VGENFTITEIDREEESLVVDTGMGAKEAFALTGHTSEDARKASGKRRPKVRKSLFTRLKTQARKGHFFEAI